MKNYLILLLSVIILTFVSCKNKGNKELLQFAYCLKDVEGSGKYNLETKLFNAETAFNKKEIDLKGKRSEKVQLDLNVTDKSIPYVAVISLDKEPDLQREIVGSFIKPSFKTDQT